MKIYKASFKKKSGESRMMVFSRITDLPSDFLEKNVQGADSFGASYVWRTI